VTESLRWIQRRLLIKERTHLDDSGSRHAKSVSRYDGGRRHYLAPHRPESGDLVDFHEGRAGCAVYAADLHSVVARLKRGEEGSIA
jgi:hypothetical protein